MTIFTELALGGESVHRIGGADLCKMLDVSAQTLTELHQRGLAVRLGHDAYDLGATVRAYTAHLRSIASGRGGEDQVLALTVERARLAKEQADGQAIKNAEKRGELLGAADVARVWGDTLRGLRARLLALPSRLRADLPHLSASDVAVIDRTLRDTLTELAHADD